MSTFNAPPDQINGLTLNNGDTLNLGQRGTVSNITVLNGADFDITGGTAIDTTLAGTTLFAQPGTINGITFEGDLTNSRPSGSIDELFLSNPSSLEGNITFGDFQHGSYSAE